MTTARRLAVFTVFATLVLVAIGVLVRATGSGLGCPDWPTCDGGVVPPAEKHPLIEMSHRLAATVVGLLVVAVAVLAWKHYRHAPVVVWTALATVPLVGFQGLLGAVTVKRALPPEIVATHLLTAMAVLSFQVVVAAGMYLDDPAHRKRLLGVLPAAAPPRRLGLLVLATAAWLALVMWVGGYMTESGASTACTSWPACNGSLLPGSDDQQITHMAHRYLAGALSFLMVPLVLFAWRHRRALPWATSVALALAALYVLQVAVGALNVLYEFPEPLAISHTVIASLIWTLLSTAAALAFWAPASVRSAAPVASSRVPA
ncbi:MAG: COX15/CtaA family protein [Tepidiformaceae bacterium]